MNHEDLIAFRDSVAYPAMKKLFERTDIPEGFCCIDSVSISFFDGRSCGVDNEFTASGLRFQNGRAEAYEFSELDIDFPQFAAAHKDCFFCTDGKLEFSNELDEFRISTVIRNFSTCAKICPDLEGYESLNFASVSSETGIKFEKLKYLYAGDDYLSLNQQPETLKVGSDNKDFVFTDELSAWIDGNDICVSGSLAVSDVLLNRLKEEIHNIRPSAKLDSMDGVSFNVFHNLTDSSMEVRGFCYFFDAGVEQEECFELSVNAEEKKIISEAMETYCKEVHGKSFQNVISEIQNNECPFSDMDYFDFGSECIYWTYYNPDSYTGGQFVTVNVPYERALCIAAEYKEPGAFFAYLLPIDENQYCVDKGDPNFLSYAKELQDSAVKGCSAVTMDKLISEAKKHVKIPLTEQMHSASLRADIRLNKQDFVPKDFER